RWEPISGRFRPAEPRLYLHVERGAAESTSSIFILEIYGRGWQWFNLIRENIPQQYHCDDDQKQRPKGYQNPEDVLQKALVMKAISLHSLRGRQDDRGQYA